MKISNNLNSSNGSSPAASEEGNHEEKNPNSNMNQKASPHHVNSWAKEKLASLLEKQQALLRAYTTALEEHRLVVVVLLGIILLMSVIFSLLFLVNFRLVNERKLVAAFRPQRIRLLFDEGRNQLAVEWFTANRTGESMVWYGTRTFTSSAIGGGQLEVDKGTGQPQYKHLVLFGDLIPGINYQYKVGSHEMVSEVRYFKVPERHRLKGSFSSFSGGVGGALRLFHPTVVDPEMLEQPDHLEKIFADGAKALDGVLARVLDDLRRVDSLINDGNGLLQMEEEEDEEGEVKGEKVMKKSK